MTRPAPKGFTLVEAMVAGTVFLAVFAGLIGGFIFVAHQYAHQQKMTEALAVGEQVMEELLLVQRDDGSIVEGGTFSRTYNANGIEVPGGAYTVTWNVVAADPVPGVRSIDLRVQWAEKLGNRQLQLQSNRP